MRLRLVLWLALLGVTVVFVTQNAQAVEVHFLFWSVAMSQALLLIFVLVAGFSLGWLLHAWIAWNRMRGAEAAPIQQVPGHRNNID